MPKSVILPFSNYSKAYKQKLIKATKLIMVLRLKRMEVAYGVASTVYITEEQSDTINNKRYLDVLTGFILLQE